MDTILDPVAYNGQRFLKMYMDVMDQGVIRNPRGTVTKEIVNYEFHIDPRYPCISFKARNFNLQYAAAELIWY